MAISEAGATKKLRLTRNTIKTAVPHDKDYVLWDSELKGFGLRVLPSGAKSFIVQYRAGKGRRAPNRKVTLGKCGPLLAPEAARKMALNLLGAVVAGDDPAKTLSEEKRSITLSDLCDLYLEFGCATKKASTIAIDEGRIRRHIRPVLGSKRVKDLTRGDALDLQLKIANGAIRVDEKTKARGRARVSGGKPAANRTVQLLSAILNFACDRGIIESNVAQGIRKFPEQKRERFLSEEELERLGRVITAIANDGANPMAIAIVRLLIFTGARRGEIENLTWPEVDFENRCLRLMDSKTGRKVIPLSNIALSILREQPRFFESPYVFPATSGDGRFRGLSKVWRRIRFCAGLEDLRLHDLRHTFASVGAASGIPLPVVGKILGHADQRMTSRYAHIADDPVFAGAEKVADLLAERLGADV